MEAAIFSAEAVRSNCPETARLIENQEFGQFRLLFNQTLDFIFAQRNGAVQQRLHPLLYGLQHALSTQVNNVKYPNAINTPSKKLNLLGL